MEWWVGVPEAQQATLTQLFRIVWAMLLRQTQLPIIIICAGRRIPSFKHPLLRLVLHDFKLNGFPAADIVSLVQANKQAMLLPLINRYIEGNLRATQILNKLVTKYPNAFAGSSIPEFVLREIFDTIVGKQLENDLILKETLYQLAQQRQAGFTANDPLLPKGDASLIKLINTSFVEFDSSVKRYFVIAVLSRWFTIRENWEYLKDSNKLSITWGLWPLQNNNDSIVQSDANYDFPTSEEKILELVVRPFNFYKTEQMWLDQGQGGETYAKTNPTAHALGRRTK